MPRSLTCKDQSTAQSQSGWSGIGVAGFAFFLLKGLLWLLAPALFTLWR